MRPSSLDQNRSKKGFLQNYRAVHSQIEFIDIFHEIGKNSEAGGRPEEHIFAFQEHNFNCVTIAKPRVGKVIDRLPSFFALIFELPAQNTLFIT